MVGGLSSGGRRRYHLSLYERRGVVDGEFFEERAVKNLTFFRRHLNVRKKEGSNQVKSWMDRLMDDAGETSPSITWLVFELDWSK